MVNEKKKKKLKNQIKFIWKKETRIWSLGRDW